ncbi:MULTISPECIES: hypothetical protein [Mycolicibacter]|nr:MULTISPECIES: hypothetical protein [Mycolicibacter]ULP46567.1 hypothetical protein MJO54_17375 [Mycolicibacter virginiensis]
MSVDTAVQHPGTAAVNRRSHSARTTLSASSSTSAVKVSVVIAHTSFTG